MTTPEQFTLQSQNLGCLPIVNFFLARMGVADHLRTYLPSGDARRNTNGITGIPAAIRSATSIHSA
jgi:hypothetical protein